MKRSYILLAGVALAMILVACGGGGEVTTPAPTPTPTTPQPTTPEAGTYRQVTVTNGGIIAGVVSYSGTPPSGKSLSVNKDIDVCGASKVNEKLQVS